MKTNISAIDKLRKIVGWANYQNEAFNQRIRSIKDLVYTYDFCQQHDVDFADELKYEEPLLYAKLSKKLGYEL